MVKDEKGSGAFIVLAGWQYGFLQRCLTYNGRFRS
jgi:hypothetical protein